ncbi:MAG: YraN family protein [Bacteroidetes bacterium]|nr:YraN family protein [Bacteroidota bacterium]
MALHNDIGKQGEEAAIDFLRKNGHEILANNYRDGKAEIDIISKHKNAIVFTEVKTRSNNFFGNPEEFVDRKKKKLMIQAAEEYMQRNNSDADIRFDIISILLEKGKMNINHIQDAFFNLDNEQDDIYH